MQKHKEKPILFNSEMVKAVLAGRKTQTRRVLKPQPDTSLWKASALLKEKEWRRQPCLGPGHEPEENMWCLYDKGDKGGALPYTGVKCPYGQVGDRLWVRECFSYPEISDFILWNVPSSFHQDVSEKECGFHYWADGDPEYGDWTKPKPSIHMPRRASRINLEIVDIRIERVQDIRMKDIASEGILIDESVVDEDSIHWAYLDAWRELWDSINEKRGYGWGVNPWVWVVEFKVL